MLNINQSIGKVCICVYVVVVAFFFLQFSDIVLEIESKTTLKQNKTDEIKKEKKMPVRKPILNCGHMFLFGVSFLFRVLRGRFKLFESNFNWNGMRQIVLLAWARCSMVVCFYIDTIAACLRFGNGKTHSNNNNSNNINISTKSMQSEKFRHKKITTVWKRTEGENKIRM